ncbi:MAG: hypothetical protein AB1668_07300 [Nanoarchaeota archaeon]
MDKKGQGMSVNVIIVAALALVVLVVLIVIFTRQTTTFGEKVSEETRTELVKLKISYDSCHPGQSLEDTFSANYEKAGLAEDKDLAISDFKGEIERCKGFSQSKQDCEAESGCVWS